MPIIYFPRRQDVARLWLECGESDVRSEERLATGNPGGKPQWRVPAIADDDLMKNSKIDG